ncbi:MAG: hypothetical protein HYW50_00350, partial [Candidatus Diapherotrites archaeon]|nr:hypothetical protein [Candidatus Diapherotrites archaeon]
MAQSKTQEFKPWHVLEAQRISPQTIEPPAKEIVYILNSIENALKTGKPVFLLHMPRGATPIVEGLKYAWKKKYGQKRIPYTTLVLPVSRENVSDDKVVEVFKERMKGIPAGAIVVYVDEVVSGRNAYFNIQDLYKILKKKHAGLYAHLLVSREGRLVDPEYSKKLDQMRRFKSARGLQIIYHNVPEFLPWTDNSRNLGQNWGLVHKFPFDLILNACGGTRKAQEDIKMLAAEFSKEYERQLMQVSEISRFKTLRVPSRTFRSGYAVRNILVVRALKHAVAATGFQDKYQVKFRGMNIIVNGQKITFPKLQQHLTDTHPSHEIQRGRKDYKHFLQSDPNILIDFSHSGEGGRRRLIPPFQRLSFYLMHSLKSAIGQEVHRQKHPKNKRK